MLVAEVMEDAGKGRCDRARGGVFSAATASCVCPGDASVAVGMTFQILDESLCSKVASEVFASDGSVRSGSERDAEVGRGKRPSVHG